MSSPDALLIAAAIVFVVDAVISRSLQSAGLTVLSLAFYFGG